MVDVSTQLHSAAQRVLEKIELYSTGLSSCIDKPEQIRTSTEDINSSFENLKLALAKAFTSLRDGRLIFTPEYEVVCQIAQDNGLNVADVLPIFKIGPLGHIERIDSNLQFFSNVESCAHLCFLKSIKIIKGCLSEIEPFASLPELEMLSITFSRVSNLNYLAGLNLKELNLSFNAISDLTPLANMFSLKKLKLDNNAIGSVAALSGLVDLRELGIRVAAVGGISDLASLKKLHVLHASKNRIEDISCIAQMGALEVLDVSFNPIADLTPLAGHNSLTQLNIEKVHATDLSPLLTMPKLKRLLVSGELLNSGNSVIKQLQNKKIQVKHPC